MPSKKPPVEVSTVPYPIAIETSEMVMPYPEFEETLREVLRQVEWALREICHADVSVKLYNTPNRVSNPDGTVAFVRLHYGAKAYQKAAKCGAKVQGITVLPATIRCPINLPS